MKTFLKKFPARVMGQKMIGTIRIYGADLQNMTGKLQALDKSVGNGDRLLLKRGGIAVDAG